MPLQSSGRDFGTTMEVAVVMVVDKKGRGACAGNLGEAAHGWGFVFFPKVNKRWLQHIEKGQDTWKVAMLEAAEFHRTPSGSRN